VRKEKKLYKNRLEYKRGEKGKERNERRNRTINRKESLQRLIERENNNKKLEGGTTSFL
jgi:hypothetical protein